MISRAEGIVHVRRASRIIRKILFISTKAATGPAGPFENAVWMKDLPTESKTAAAIPIENSFQSMGSTLLQYQETPRIRIKKLETLEVPKLTVFALKLYLGFVINLVKKDWAKKKQGVMNPHRIAIQVGA